MNNSVRDHCFDNLKGILIFLVVLGHAISKLQGKSLLIAGGTCSLIYSFHMPAFIFLSGYFSKSASNDESYAKKQVKSVLIPFVIAQLLMWMITSRSISLLFYPRWTLWYLLSLFIWRMFVVPVSRLRYSILISVFVSLCIGFSSGDQLFSVSRTAAFFPFFLIGYKTTSTKIYNIRKVNKFIPVMILIALFSIVLVLKKYGVPAIAYTMDKPYKSFEGFTKLQAMTFRMIALLIGAISTCCLIILVPQKHSFISTLGRNSMTVYLGHAFCLIIIGKLVSAFSPAFISKDIIVLLLSILLSTIICLLFGNGWIVKKYNSLLNKVSAVALINDDHTINQTK